MGDEIFINAHMAVLKFNGFCLNAIICTRLFLDFFVMHAMWFPLLLLPEEISMVCCYAKYLFIYLFLFIDTR